VACRRISRVGGVAGAHEAASQFVDNDQTSAGAYKHAMRDGATNQPAMAAQDAWGQFIYDSLTAARRTGNRALALSILGERMHALMDSTAPAHRGFQPWSSSFCDNLNVRHFFKDRSIDAQTELKTAALLRTYYEAYLTGAPFHLP